MMTPGVDSALTIEPTLAPGLEICFRDVSVSVDVKVLPQSDAFELPSTPNTIKKAFAPSHTAVVKKQVLHKVSGVFRPGSMTLILGQSGSGKSSLMKLLSGRFPTDKSTAVEGEVTYNGIAKAAISPQLPSAVSYVPQRDTHFPTLTVKETLAFAHAFTGGDPSQPSVGAVIAQLGLEKCQDTVVGDAMLRGVSGGERKCVTIGEMAFGVWDAALMDEITTGLDSATAFEIVQAQRRLAKAQRKTIVMALLQPAPEVFGLFDDVMLLKDGHVLYYGPTNRAVDHFRSIGLACPPGRDVADFLLDLGTEQQQQYERGHDSVPRDASALVGKFCDSQWHGSLQEQLDKHLSLDMEVMHAAAAMRDAPAFRQSLWSNTATLVKRQSMLAWRDKQFIAGRSVMTVVMGLLYASTFYQFDPTNVQVVLGVIFSSAIFVSISQMSQLPVFMAAREVFYKQRGANLYRSSSYVIAAALSQVPLALLESVAFGSLVYWVCGFDASASSFLLFLVVLTLSNLAMGMWFMFVAAITPNMFLAHPLPALSTTLFVIFAGFVVLRGQIPDYLIEFYWISPISWAVRTLAVIQYRSDALDVCQYAGVDYCATFGRTAGEYYLDVFEIPADRSWIGLGVVYLVGAMAVFMTLATLALEYCRYNSPEGSASGPTRSADSDQRVRNDIVGLDDDSLAHYALAESPSSRNGAENAGHTHDDALNVVEDPKIATAFTPVTIAFHDLWYSVPSPKDPKKSQPIDLLKGVSEFARPGTLTALMGATGAGKTTLLDVIAGRKTGGAVKGKVFLNGHEASDLAIRRSTGYCEQMDVHCESATIREALAFSALLRQDATVSDRDKLLSVDEVLALLDLTRIADKMVRGSSVEQMKRLSIGVELAAQPSVLFLDEPTSGLDARSAKIVMDGVRKVGDSGRIIICTIHQPSSEVFALFDSLLLLRHGETVFFGELDGSSNTRGLVRYFEDVPGVQPLSDGVNPATWMLECMGTGANSPCQTGTDDESDRFVKFFNSSKKKQVLAMAVANEDGIARPAATSQPIEFARKRAASSSTQLRLVVGRFAVMYWRTPSYTLTVSTLLVLLALLFGIVFVDGGTDYATYQGLNSGMGMLFVTVLFSGIVSLSSVIPLAMHDRAAFYRERASQTYSAVWYFVGPAVAEVPYALAGSLVFTLVFFPMVGFSGVGNAVLFWLNFALFTLQQAYVGQLCAFIAPSEEVATVLGLLVSNTLYIYTGFSPPYSAIPTGYKWLYHANPFRYPLAVAVALTFTDCSTAPFYNVVTAEFEDVEPELGCQPLRGAPVSVGNVTVRQFTATVFGVTHDKVARDFAVTIAYIALYRGLALLALLALRFVNHQKK